MRDSDPVPVWSVVVVVVVFSIRYLAALTPQAETTRNKIWNQKKFTRPLLSQCIARDGNGILRGPRKPWPKIYSYKPDSLLSLSQVVIDRRQTSQVRDRLAPSPGNRLDIL